MSKLAKEIRDQLVRTPTHKNDGCACITDSAGNIHIPPHVLEAVIAAKLEPVREVLNGAGKIAQAFGPQGYACRAFIKDALALLFKEEEK